MLTSTGNGYFCTRGSAEWADVDDVHYPGTYAHGCYNRETTIMGGRPVLNEDLVNLPNWLVLKLRIGGDEPINLKNVELLSYRHEVDFRNATVMRRLRFRDRRDRESTLESRRFVSMADMHQAALELTITAENWSGPVEVITALDARVINQGVARYRELEGHHLHPVASRTPCPDTISLIAQTRQSRIYVAEAARTRVYRDSGEMEAERGLYSDGGLRPTDAGLRPPARTTSPCREAGLVLHLSRPGAQRASDQRREGGRAFRHLPRDPRPSPACVGRAMGRLRHPDAQ